MAESYSFRRSSRLTNNVEFQRVFKSNLKIGNSNMTLLVARQSSNQPRLGFAIAKKQVKKAVDRNRLKRIFRESFRQHLAILPPQDFVIMVKHKIIYLTNQQIFELMHNNWMTVINKMGSKSCENC